MCVCVCYSELEECLLVMPFSDVTDFLKLLDIWIQVGVDWKLSWNRVTLSLSLSLHRMAGRLSSPADVSSSY